MLKRSYRIIAELSSLEFKIMVIIISIILIVISAYAISLFYNNDYNIKKIIIQEKIFKAISNNADITTIKHIYLTTGLWQIFYS